MRVFVYISQTMPGKQTLATKAILEGLRRTRTYSSKALLLAIHGLFAGRGCCLANQIDLSDDMSEQVRRSMVSMKKTLKEANTPLNLTVAEVFASSEGASDGVSQFYGLVKAARSVGWAITSIAWLKKGKAQIS